MVSFVNFGRIASICVGFHLGTLHGYYFHYTLAKFEFPARNTEIKLVIICQTTRNV